MGTLGAGNHYAEVQVVEKVYDAPAARKMGIDTPGQVRGARLHVAHCACMLVRGCMWHTALACWCAVAWRTLRLHVGARFVGGRSRTGIAAACSAWTQVCIMIHSGSRGLGHQVATDALVEMEAAMARDGITTNDRQLACARISSPEGQVRWMRARSHTCGACSVCR